MWYSMWEEKGRHIVAFAATTRGTPRVIINTTTAGRAATLAAEHHAAQARRPRLVRKGSKRKGSKRPTRMTPERRAIIAARLKAKRERAMIARARRAERREKLLAAKAARRERLAALRAASVRVLIGKLDPVWVARAEAARLG